jgi:hypothetical protein
MSKQTSVDFLLKEFSAIFGKVNFTAMQGLLMKDAVEKARVMEKEQMWEYIKKNYCIGHKSLEFHRLEFEQYYNETYKKEEK